MAVAVGVLGRHRARFGELPRGSTPVLRQAEASRRAIAWSFFQMLAELNSSLARTQFDNRWRPSHCMPTAPGSCRAGRGGSEGQKRGERALDLRRTTHASWRSS